MSLKTTAASCICREGRSTKARSPIWRLRTCASTSTMRTWRSWSTWSTWTSSSKRKLRGKESWWLTRLTNWYGRRNRTALPKPATRVCSTICFPSSMAQRSTSTRRRRWTRETFSLSVRVLLRSRSPLIWSSSCKVGCQSGLGWSRWRFRTSSTFWRRRSTTCLCRP